MKENYANYDKTGMQALFRFTSPAWRGMKSAQEEYNIAHFAQNEGNLNQNLETLYRKLEEIEDYLAQTE
ncbi:MAG: hypothetical protein R2881_04780 [Eubacteriales bacterium]